MPPIPSAAASRMTSTGKCFASSQASACGAIFSAAKVRAMSRTAIWSSGSAKSDIGKCRRQKRGRSAVAPQAIDHLAIGDLMRVFIIVLERAEARERGWTDHPIGQLGELADGVVDADRRGKDDRRRLADFQQPD